MKKLAFLATLQRVKSRSGAGVIMLSFLAFGAWLATSSSNAVGANLRADTLQLNAPPSGARDIAQETLSTQPSTSRTTASQRTHLPDKPSQSEDGRNNPQGKPRQPYSGSNPTPPNGGPVVKPGRPSGHSQLPGRPSVRPPAHHYPHHGYVYPNYAWNRGNVRRLHSYFYEDMRRVNQWHRWHLFVGGYFPRRYESYIQPIPPSLMVYLSPVPPRYEIGYFDGYCFVYDPRSLLVVSVVDVYAY
jgi:Ni/Co efflux regulator RcnB